MIETFIGFNKCILAMKAPWKIWMGLLVSVNMILPWFFWGNLEAIVVLVGIMVSMCIMLTLYAKYEFVRLLGLGHFPWLFTVPWLFMQLDKTSGAFYYWLLAVIILNGISLVIDAVDVIRYGLGERTPIIATI